MATKKQLELMEKQKIERLGEERINNQDLKMKIIEYIKSEDIIVEFEIDGYRKKTTYSTFKKGEILNPNFKRKVANKKAERINQVGYNNDGEKMFICQYDNSANIYVEFCDEYHGRVHTDYRSFVKGEVRNPYKVGRYGQIVGNEYPTKIKGKRTKEYATWCAMIHRVFESKNGNWFQSYRDVLMCEEWLFYPNFVKWVQEQSNYEKWKISKEKEWALDKDILSGLNNKIYSPQTCCLVPMYVNMAIIEYSPSGKKDNLPCGVIEDNGEYFYRRNKYYVYASSLEEAHKGYLEYRSKIRKEVANKAYINGDITERCYKALMDDNFIYR